MKWKLFDCKVDHQRNEPVDHSFSYPLLLLGVRLDSLQEESSHQWVVGYNRPAVLSIWDKDYLFEGEEALQSKVLRLLTQKGVDGPFGRMELVTAPRYFGYSFNPVSFYFVFNLEEIPVAFVAEVNNTFGDKHVYVFGQAEKNNEEWYWDVSSLKAFHVSPFNDVSGCYHFQVKLCENRFQINIDIEKEGRALFHSCVRGIGQQCSGKQTLLQLLRAPIRIWRTMPQILFQAFRLHFQKKLVAYRRPNPESVDTLRSRRPYLKHRIAMRIIFKELNKISTGTLILDLPDGSTRVFPGAHDRERVARIRVRNFDFFTRCVFGADIGFAESYVDNDWCSDDLISVLQLAALNYECVQLRKSWLSRYAQVRDFFRHRSKRNSLEGSRENIHAHYDLSNSLFRSFLDSSMTYSSGFFATSETSLFDAQMAKLDMLIDSLELESNHHLLEIGSGWGSFAIRAARRTGCRVTTVTVSERQFTFVRRLLKREGLEGQVEVRLEDYRSLEGKFDRIASLEMLEAVGEEYLDEYFAQMRNLLTPGGIAGVQFISLPQERQSRYRRSSDWIQKYIFPGCYIPSRERVLASIKRAGGMHELSFKSFGTHYATTLRMWRTEFFKERDRIEALGFDERFMRLWSYYLSYCEAGFAVGLLDVHQQVLRSVERGELRYGGADSRVDSKVYRSPAM